MRTPRPVDPSAPPVLHVHTPDGRVLRFTAPFVIGRDVDCELRLDDVHVSRKHVCGEFAGGQWQLRDLKSANGLFVDGRRIQTATITGSISLTVGLGGPTLLIELEGGVSPRNSALAGQATVQSEGSESELLAQYEQRYFGSAPVAGAGGRTRIIRQAFERVQKKQRRRYEVVVAVAVLVAAGAGVFAYVKHQRTEEQRAIAEGIFYQMKALDVSIATVERMIAESGSPEAREQVEKSRAARIAMEKDYDRLSVVRKLYDSDLSEEDRLILRVTRAFGECDLTAPDEYMDLVRTYIKRWQQTDRYRRAVGQARQMGFAKGIADEMAVHGLPPQFFYLAMQESSFEPFASGPPTYMGIAKGMWQFIPETGQRYGLKVGPLVKVRQPDPDDDRHDWRKATTAAARYLKDIYRTDAQASGLLVMASYNWGENRVIRLIRSLPEHPQDRNFWKLLEKYGQKVPPETYDYVFYIVSAAVIGENPRLFGFPIDNPLQ